jgi:hypothetical protein
VRREDTTTRVSEGRALRLEERRLQRPILITKSTRPHLRWRLQIRLNMTHDVAHLSLSFRLLAGERPVLLASSHRPVRGSICLSLYVHT